MLTFPFSSYALSNMNSMWVWDASAFPNSYCNTLLPVNLLVFTSERACLKEKFCCFEFFQMKHVHTEQSVYIFFFSWIFVVFSLRVQEPSGLALIVKDPKLRVTLVQQFLMEPLDAMMKCTVTAVLLDYLIQINDAHTS